MGMLSWEKKKRCPRTGKVDWKIQICVFLHIIMFDKKEREDDPHQVFDSEYYCFLHIGPNPVLASINAYRSFSFRSFNRHAIPRRRITSMATMPKSAVKILLLSELAKDEKGPMHPCRFTATRVLVHTLSGMNGGVVAFQYPQQLNLCWSSDCVPVV